MKIAILDDYQNIALEMADWTPVQKKAEVIVFNDTVGDPAGLVSRLADFDVVCVMRERSPLTAAILEQLPKLKLIVSTGPRNASIDVEAAKKHGVEVRHTGYLPTPAVELTWALILAAARHIPAEAASLRSGGWQVSVGSDLYGSTLGILGLGNLGTAVAAVGKALGMEVIAWSENLTAEKAKESGVTSVTKDEVFKRSDFLSIHLVLSERSLGLVGAPQLALMKKTALLVNTSRGPIVDEAALVHALETKQIAGAALDVFNVEPLPADHPYRTLPNVLATPHVGYISRSQYKIFYGDTVNNILTWLEGKPAV